MHNSPNVPCTPRKRCPSTPRKRKLPPPNTLQGLRVDLLAETVADVKAAVMHRLGLSFAMEDWQAHLIHRIHQGYDSIFVAGTGYGKSLIFQGLAALDEKKTVIVIAPLKALERDQVSEAKAKNLTAVMINGDTACPELWVRIRQGLDNIYYVSPEMALGDTFLALWADVSFRSHVQTVIVDEAHCVREWGDTFRKQYGDLSRVRLLMGGDIPMVACTATCSEETFEVLWTSLNFGYRPFWGIDVGCDRKNLTYLIQPLQSTKNPVLNILNILPPTIPSDATSKVIPKSLFYFDTVRRCREAMETLRKILPPHLRLCIQTFVGITSEAGKALIWDRFKNGEIRILCATDAAGMGCNVPDVQFVALFAVPRSISVLVQQWGRGGRNRTLSATCFLFAQKWAFRPKGTPKLNRKGKPKPLEPKDSKSSRENIESALEELINLSDLEPTQPGRCVHHFIRKIFRPETQLHVFKDLIQNYLAPDIWGPRSRTSNFQLSWTILPLNAAFETISGTTCCGVCSPNLLEQYPQPTVDDSRLSAYGKDFLFPLQIRGASVAEPSQRVAAPASSLAAQFPAQRPHSFSIGSNTSTTSQNSDSMSAVAIPMSQAEFVPLRHIIEVSQPLRDNLRSLLNEWRDTYTEEERKEPSLFTIQTHLPDQVLEALVKNAGHFLQVPDVTRDAIRQVVQWDLATTKALREVGGIIHGWRQKVKLQLSPSHGRQQKKVKGNTNNLRENDAIENDPTPHPSTRQLFIDPLSRSAFSSSGPENPFSRVASDPEDRPPPFSNIMASPLLPRVTDMSSPPAIDRGPVPRPEPLPRVSTEYYLPTPLGGYYNPQHYPNVYGEPQPRQPHGPSYAQGPLYPYGPPQHAYGPPHVPYPPPTNPVCPPYPNPIGYANSPMSVVGTHVYMNVYQGQSQPAPLPINQHVPVPAYMYPQGRVPVMQPNFFYDSQFSQAYMPPHPLQFPSYPLVSKQY